MRYHKKQEIFLIDGEQLNKCIWACEQIMDIFGEQNEGMLIRYGRLREQLINKITYSKILDRLGIPQAPPEDDVSLTEFLDQFGLKLPDKGNKK